MTKYDYLKKYIYNPQTYTTQGSEFHVSFSKITKEEIVEAEKKAEIIFPNSLKEFWLEIGAGWFRQSINTTFEDSSDSDNELREPEWIAQIITDPDNGEWCYYVDDNNEEMLERGYFPFFDVQQSEYFFWMRPGSDSVYAPGEEIIEENFEDFIYNLYHIHPGYYWKNMLEPEYWNERKLEDESKRIIDANWHKGRHRNKS